MVIKRENGSDGTISCMIKTDAISDKRTPNTAMEFDDYCPIMLQITFPHSETEMRVPIILVNSKLSDEEGEDSEEVVDVMF